MMIKNKLMVLLAENELKLSDLAEKTGIRYATLWNFAKNKTQAVSYEMLSQICKTMHCDVGDILKYEQNALKKITKVRRSK